jgi:hypothetical protein
MSNEQKVALARRAKSDDGLPPVLAALELPRSSWYYHQNHRRAYTEKYAHLREPLEAIAREHPAYGYRRTTVELREVHGYAINHKVVQKLHQEWDLPLIRSVKPPKPSGVRQAITVAGDRVNLVAGREQIAPFNVAYADFTELIYADGRRKAYLIPIVDHGSKSKILTRDDAGMGSGSACSDGTGVRGLGASEADFDRVRRGPAGGHRAS